MYLAVWRSRGVERRVDGWRSGLAVPLKLECRGSMARRRDGGRRSCPAEPDKEKAKLKGTGERPL
jgi:hypothetical protein